MGPTLKHLAFIFALMQVYSCSLLAPVEDSLDGDYPIRKKSVFRSGEGSRIRSSDLGESSLDKELGRLEQAQSHEDYDLYYRYKNKLSTTSEKIYFLRLPSHERKDYLDSRGFIEVRSPRAPSSEVRFGLRRDQLTRGMSKADVLDGFGRPSRVEVAGNPSYENERWLYVINGATKYIYFESGQVDGWE